MDLSSHWKRVNQLTCLSQLKVFGAQCLRYFLFHLCLLLHRLPESIQDALERELLHCSVVTSLPQAHFRLCHAVVRNRSLLYLQSDLANRRQWRCGSPSPSMYTLKHQSLMLQLIERTHTSSNNRILLPCH